MNKLFYILPIICVLAIGTTATNPVENSNDIECSLCHFVADKIKDYIEQNKTDTEIIHLIENVCKITGNWKDKCISIIDNYGKIIIDEVVELGDDKVCQLVGLCAMLKSNELDKCTLCKLSVGEVYHLLESGEVKEEIERVLDGMCKIFPNKEEQIECGDFINTFAEMIITFLENDEDPQTLCDQLNLCN